MIKRIRIILPALFLLSGIAVAQTVSNAEIRSRIEKYKADIRGPYKEIRWYCPDGSIIPPKERCPEPGGIQRARHKDEATKLAETNHIFLGQILATTPFPDFWDDGKYNSRLKQFELEKYLRSSDNGWVLRKAQFYRGAYQAEDEEQWGVNFFNWLLTNTRALEKQFFLIREAAKDIPHGADNDLKQNIRLVSKEISDTYSSFLDLRVKIHGQPEASDVEKVKQFMEAHKTKMDREQLAKMNMLIKDMKKQYQPFEITSINPLLSTLPKESAIHKSLVSFQTTYKTTQRPPEKISLLSASLNDIRPAVLSSKSPKVRLALLDVSIILEDLLFKELALFKPETLFEQISAITDLGKAATGCGYLEIWEWERLKNRINVTGKTQVSEPELFQIFESCRSITEWGTGMFMAIYEDVVHLYSGFEPLANGFIDEKIRSSLLLQIGNTVNFFGESISSLFPVSNKIMEIPNVSASRGLNPGFAKGELVVISGKTDDIIFEKDKIYVFNKPPANLKPVAGIATVTEGNPVSHIQLLARNLGIPNAVVNMQILEGLKKYNGQTIFYAVSSKGVVVMKPENTMSMQETTLFEKKKREETRISVPIDKIDLNHKKIMNLSNVDASVSGKTCGPKAANLGQLKKMFPEHVVDGLVIPFGIFKEHLNQPMPGQNITYWAYLNQIFERSAAMKKEGKNEADIEALMLKELHTFHQSIKQIKLSDKLVAELQQMFREVFKKELGTIAVFLRSDTNMEDLKDFTGAGLNLTLFNVVSTEVILQGIRDVWASPYTERSYKWRQRYLLNPENVFPSILIIPTVNVDYSGVVVTKGIGQGTSDDLTVAFSRGAGGAVDGQAAESYLLQQNGKNVLLTPAREPQLRTLPEAGGSKMVDTYFEKPILGETNIDELRKISLEIKTKLPKTPGIETTGPFDIELGFKDNKLWLFQVRPFVENKNAAGQLYLEALNPVLSPTKVINLN